MTSHQQLRAGISFAAMVAVLWAAGRSSPRQPADEKTKQIPHIIKQPSTVPDRADIPNAEVAKQLRGVAPPPIATPDDKLPLPQLKLPHGFRPRSMSPASPMPGRCG